MDKNQTIISETPRLILRKFKPDDLDELIPILGDPEVMRFSRTGAKTPKQTKQFIDRILRYYQQEGFGLYAVNHKKDAKLIGYCGLLIWLIDEQREIEIGYRLARNYWGQGLATEAASAIRDYAKKFAFDSLIAVIDLDNHRSIRVAKKLGMKYEKDTKDSGMAVQVYRLDNN